MLTRRTFITTATVATGLALTPFAIGRAAADSSPPVLTAYIDGQAVDREAVPQWEARRLVVAADRIRCGLPGALAGELDALVGGPAVSTADVASDRQLLADVKMRLGEADMRTLMAADLAISGPASEVAATAQLWSISNTGLASTSGTADGFVGWFNSRLDQNDERAMLVANPDHYLIRTPRPGAQEVIEVTGGAVFGARFLIDYADNAGVPITRDPAARSTSPAGLGRMTVPASAPSATSSETIRVAASPRCSPRRSPRRCHPG